MIEDPSGSSGSLPHKLKSIVADHSGMTEEMLWVELLSADPVRKLIAYAQRNFADERWMDARELARQADVSENTIYRYTTEIGLLDVYEQKVEGGTTYYRPNSESYVLSYCDDMEAIIRHNITTEEQ